MRIAADHPDAGNPLLDAMVRALSRRGVDVVIDRLGENLIRALPGGRGVIEAQGLPNLVHEFVHVLRAGVIADDHGFDYGQIPLRLDTPEGRDVLFDELTCCVVSCMWLDAPESRVHAWFAEQVEIQPVFYGMEHEPQRFFAAIDQLAREHGEELARRIDATLAAMIDELRIAGAAPDTLEIPSRIPWTVFWGVFRSR